MHFLILTIRTLHPDLMFGPAVTVLVTVWLLYPECLPLGNSGGTACQNRLVALPKQTDLHRKAQADSHKSLACGCRCNAETWEHVSPVLY